MSRRPSRPGRRGARAPSILLAAVVLALSLGAAERASRRLLADVEPSGELVRDFGQIHPAAHGDYLPLTLPPAAATDGVIGHVETSALGCRGPSPATVEQPPGTRRVLVLGDSFVRAPASRGGDRQPLVLRAARSLRRSFARSRSRSLRRSFRRLRRRLISR